MAKGWWDRTLVLALSARSGLLYDKDKVPGLLEFFKKGNTMLPEFFLPGVIHLS